MPELADAVKTGISKPFIDWADNFGKELKNTNVTTSQIRSIFGAVKKMQQNALDKERLLLLRAQMAYAAKRHESLNKLKDELNAAVNMVVEAQDDEEAEKRFQRFCNGFEAILAYHRAHGAK